MYFTASATSDKVAAPAYFSDEFGAVQRRQTRTFPTTGRGRTIFDGQAGAGLAVHITVWEADHSTSAWFDNLVRACNELSKWMFDNKVWNLAMAIADPTIVGGIAMEIAGFFVSIIEHLRNDDDLSCQRTFALGQYDLAVLAHRKTTDWHVSGDGHQILKVRYTGDPVPFPVGRLEYAIRTGDNWSAPITLLRSICCVRPLRDGRSAGTGGRSTTWARRPLRRGAGELEGDGDAFQALADGVGDPGHAGLRETCGL
ncbi:hypothetical protein [Streptomyces sp. NPDC001851]|uniref:hypothetical protein n=1 Tax=Streptomyces sp. NPDC001851 TaxID=3154529 RepID=UPI003322CF3A